MGRRTFEMVDLIEIYVHWFAGRSKSEIAASLGVDRGTLASTSRRPRRQGSDQAGRRCWWRRTGGGWWPSGSRR
jgi:transposase